MTRAPRIQRRLRDADVRLDADQDDLGVSGPQLLRHGGHEHAEEGLVGVRLAQRGLEVGLQLGDGFAQSRAVLCGRVDWDVEGLGCAEDLLGGEDAGRAVLLGLICRNRLGYR